MAYPELVSIARCTCKCIESRRIGLVINGCATFNRLMGGRMIDAQRIGGVIITLWRITNHFTGASKAWPGEFTRYESEKAMKKCTDCKYCVQQDYGYSNYTVEGTEADCLLSKHPNMPVDRFYKEEPELDYAENCGSFVYGSGPEIDCDREDDFPDGYSNDPEIVDLLKRWDS